MSVITVAGEASLQLTGALDKEGVTGPASLIVGKYHIIVFYTVSSIFIIECSIMILFILGVICERLGTNDTSFTIPINIR